MGPNAIVTKYLLHGAEVLYGLLADGKVVIQDGLLEDRLLEFQVGFIARNLHKLGDHRHDFQPHPPLLLLLKVLYEGQNVLLGLFGSQGLRNGRQ